jgi:hypothetical protein
MKQRTLCMAVVLVLSLAIRTSQVHAQADTAVQADAPAQPNPSPVRDSYWLSVGLGVGTEDAAGHAALAYVHGPHLFAIRAAATSGLFDDGFGDLALLYGRATRSDNGRARASLGAGMSLVDGCIEPGEGSLFGDCVNQKTVVGFPIEAQLAWLPAKGLGVGLYGFADLNRIRSFGGVTLGLQIGRVR